MRRYTNIFELMADARQSIQPIDEQIATLRHQRSEAAHSLISQIGERVLGQTIRATLLEPGTDDEPVIEQYKRYRNNNYNGELRSHSGTGKAVLYTPAAFRFRPIERADGLAVGIDVDNSSLVLRKSGLSIFESYYWVRLINQQEDPLVNISRSESS